MVSQQLRAHQLVDILTHERTPVSGVGLHFDLNYTPVTFRDCILHGCDIIPLTQPVHRQSVRH